MRHAKDRIGLLNVLLAEGINLGLNKMTEASNTHEYWELMRLARWHIESDAMNRALAAVVEAQARLPMGWPSTLVVKLPAATPSCSEGC